MAGPLTADQQERGLSVLTELERLRSELAAKYGKPTQQSWEVLNESREDRARDLAGS